MHSSEIRTHNLSYFFLYIVGDSYLSLESSSGEMSMPLQSNKRITPLDTEDHNKRFLTESRWEMQKKPKPYSQFTRDRIINAWLN